MLDLKELFPDNLIVPVDLPFLLSLESGRLEDFSDIVLSTKPGLFQIIQDKMSGTMTTFPTSFVPGRLTDPNYVEPNQGPFLLGFSIATITIAGLVVMMRLYARSRRTGRGGLGIDDYTMIAALIMTTAFTVVNCLGEKRESKSHEWVLTEFCRRSIRMFRETCLRLHRKQCLHITQGQTSSNT